MIISEGPPSEGGCRVRVWFGRHAILDYRGGVDAADRYAAAMRRRFTGLTVTSEALRAETRRT
jgi:hypothetical protein